MAQVPPRDKSTDDVAHQAARIAGGSAVVMAGGIGERGLRMVTTWFLSGALGTASFGLYTFAVTVVSILQALVPLGADVGLTMFGARYLRSGEHGRLKATLISTVGIALLTGPLATVALWLAVRTGLILAGRPEEGDVLVLASGAVGLGAVLLVAVGGLIARKDMVGQAKVHQLALPGFTLVGVLIAVTTGAGLGGAVVAFVVAHLLAVSMGLVRLWSHFGALVQDRTVRPAWELGTLLRYAVPQSFARVLYRANLWVDILMLTWLATMTDVGIYRVSVALAMIGALPVMASTTMFGPVVAELVYARELDRLNRLLSIVTRWLIVVAVPLYLGVLLLPDVVLSIFDPAYQAGAVALGVLMVGQAIYVACAPTGACLTMAGYAVLNLINGVLAVGLNIALNAWLIPRHGIMGAAMASATALSLWSLLRVVQVRVLLRCSPWSFGSAMVVVGALGSGAIVHLTVGTMGWAPRIGATALAIGLLLGVIWRFGRTPEDDAVLGVVKARLARLRTGSASRGGSEE